MLTLASIIPFASIILLSTLKPGPGLLAAVSRSLSDGASKGAMVAAGNASMHVFYFVLVCLAITFTHEVMDFLVILLKALGAVFMIYLGIKEFLKLENELSFEDEEEAHSWFEHYMTGVSVCLANPLVVFLYAAIAPTFVDVASLIVNDIVILSFVVFAMNFGGLGFLCYWAGQIRKLLKEEGNLKSLRIIVGTLFILIGLAIGFSAMPFIEWEEIYF